MGSMAAAVAVQGQHRIPSEPSEPLSRLVTLGGWVHGDYGEGLPADVTVRIETDEGMPGGEQPVNASGYFEFLGLKPAHYRLTITAAGFQPYQQDVDLSSVGNRLNINVQLSPEQGSQRAALSATPARTDSQAPKNARKEYEKAVHARGEGKSSDARSHLQKAVAEYPCYARAQTDLAAVLAEQHNFNRSEAALKKSITCDPDYVVAYAGLGRLYYNERRYSESISALQQGVRRSPGSWQFYYELGSSEYGLHDYAKAEQAYLKAESLGSALPAEIHVKLADVYLKEVLYRKAYSEMQAYLRAEPNGRFAPELKGVVKRMESDGTVPPSAAPDSQSPPTGP